MIRNMLATGAETKASNFPVADKIAAAAKEKTYGYGVAAERKLAAGDRTFPCENPCEKTIRKLPKTSKNQLNPAAGNVNGFSNLLNMRKL